MKIKSISKHVLAIVLSLAVLASTLMLNTFSAFAETTPALDIWDSNEVAPSEGTGTKDDPFLIYTPEELAYVAKQIHDGIVSSCYELREDIYLNDITDPDWQKLIKGEVVDPSALEKFRPWNYAFTTNRSGSYGLSGCINGNGHVVKGAYSVANADSGTNYVGLFRSLLADGSVTDLGVESSYFYIDGVLDNSGKPAGVAGSLFGHVLVNTFSETDTSKAANISGCYVSNGYVYANNFSGGFIGEYELNNGDKRPVLLNINNCYSDVTVEGGTTASFICRLPFGKTIKVTNCYGTQNLPFAASFYVGQADLKANGFSNYYTASSSMSGYANVIKVTKENMTGKKATVTMPGLFTEGANSAWVALNKMTPQLKKFGVTSSDVWDGTEVAPSLGKGTKEEPYLIFSAEELAYVANLTTTSADSGKSNKTYRLENDIYLNDVNSDVWNKLKQGTATVEERATLNNWTYGNYKGAAGNIGFMGTLDGNNHAIKGVYIYNTYTNGGTENVHSALLKGICNATIMNLSIQNSYYEILSSGYVAPLVGYGIGTNPTIKNCYVSDDVIVKAENGTGAGLICAHEINTAKAIKNQKLVIENCYTAADIQAKKKVSILGSWYYSCALEMKNCYGTQDAPLYSNQNSTEAKNYATQAAAADITFDVNSWFQNCYSLRSAYYYIKDADPLPLTNITKLSSLEEMKGANAVGYMGNLFEVDNNTDGIKDWYVMTGETPKLFSFSGRTEAIVMGDFNVDENVNLLDLVRLAQARAKVDGVAINESNALVLEHEANYTAYLKNHLLTGTAFNEIVFPEAQ